MTAYPLNYCFDDIMSVKLMVWVTTKNVLHYIGHLLLPFLQDVILVLGVPRMYL